MSTSVQQATESASHLMSANCNALARPCCDFCGALGAQLYTGMGDWMFGVPGKWGMRRCSHCDVLWLDPQPRAEDIPGLYERYITHGSQPAKSWLGQLQSAVSQCVLARAGYPVAHPKEILPRLLALLPAAKRDAILSVVSLPTAAGGSLLDVGCGNGEFITRLRSLGWKVSGVDPDPAAVAFGQSNGLDIFTGMIADVPETLRYDVVVLNHVIEHVADPVSLLQECAKRLHPIVGRLVITTPNIHSLGHRRFGKFWRGLEVPRHFTVFSVNGLRRCIERAGLQLVSISTETRLSNMIYYQSSRAKAGELQIGQPARPSFPTKIRAHLFRLMESLTVYFGKDAGEEIFCMCSVSATSQNAMPARQEIGS